MEMTESRCWTPGPAPPERSVAPGPPEPAPPGRPPHHPGEPLPAHGQPLVQDPVPARAVFLLFVIIELLVNYDGGAIPALLDIISTAFHLGKFQQGLLGGLPYVGLVLASPVAGHVLVGTNGLSARLVVFVTMIGNVACSFAVAKTSTRMGLFVARFGAGFTQASFVIYAPVWIDQFAPRASVTTWMAGLQAAIALGVMVGYGIGAAFANEHWYIAFVIQVVALAASTALLGVCKKSWIDLPVAVPNAPGSARRLSGVSIPTCSCASTGSSFLSGSSSSTAPLWIKATRLARNRLFVSIVFALCGLFFVVTGIQFWATSYLNNVYSMSRMSVAHIGGDDPFPGVVGAYLRQPFKSFHQASVFVKDTNTELMFFDGSRWRIASTPNASSTRLPLPKGFDHYTIDGPGTWVSPDTASWPAQYTVTPILNRNLIFACFAAVAATGPTLGVLAGGQIIDRAGGYHGHENLVRSLRTCTIFGALATVTGLVVSFIEIFWAIVVGLWVVLFFGGGILPPATGMLIAAVDPDIRPFASAASMIFYNVFGYALGSILPGTLMAWIYPPDTPDPSVDPRYVELWGMRMILWWSVLGFIGMYVAWRLAEHDPEAGVEATARG